MSIQIFSLLLFHKIFKSFNLSDFTECNNELLCNTSSLIISLFYIHLADLTIIFSKYVFLGCISERSYICLTKNFAKIKHISFKRVIIHCFSDISLVLAFKMGNKLKRKLFLQLDLRQKCKV